MGRREYRREYMRRRRAAEKAAKTPPLTVLTFTLRDGLTPSESGLKNDIDGQLYDETAHLFHGVADLARLCEVAPRRFVVAGLNRLSHFIVAEAERCSFRSTPGAPSPGEYNIYVDRWNEVKSVKLNINGRISCFEDIGALTPHLGELAEKPFITAKELYEERTRFIESFKTLTGVDLTDVKTASQAAIATLLTFYDTDKRRAAAAFKEDYPTLPDDLAERFRVGQAYKAGLNFAAADAYEYHGDVVVADKHSAYPYIVSAYRLPYGLPRVTTAAQRARSGERPDVTKYNVYEVKELVIKLKPDGVPAFSVKDNAVIGPRARKDFAFFGEYPLYIDTFELELIKDNYDVKLLTYDKVYAFNRGVNPAFKKLVDFGYRLKSNPETRETGKTLINGIIGRFGAMSERRATYIKDGAMYRTTAVKSSGGYLPLAMAVNSATRLLQARAIKANRAAYLYGDTDSIFLKATLYGVNYVAAGISWGNNIGEFSKNYYDKFFYFGKKQYLLYSREHGYKKVFAGIPGEAITDKNIAELIQNGRTTVEYDSVKLNDDYTINPCKAHTLIYK